MDKNPEKMHQILFILEMHDKNQVCIMQEIIRITVLDCGTIYPNLTGAE